MKKHLASASLAILVLFAPQAGYHAPGFPPFLSGIGSAQAQSAISVDKISISTPAMTVNIPKMTVEGSSASEADIRAIFDPKGLDQLASRFMALSARSITIPEIEIKQSLPDGVEATTLYKDTVIRNISGGVIGEMVSRQSISKTKNIKPIAKGKPGTDKALPPFAMDMTMSDMVMKGLNLTLMARFLMDKAAPGEQLSTALVEQTVGKTVMSFDTVTVNIDRMAMQDMKLRPLSKPLMQTVSALEGAKQDNKGISEEDSLQVLRDMLTAMSFGNLEMTGLTTTFPAEGKKTARMSLDKIRMAGGGDLPGSFSMQGMKLDHTDARVSVGDFSVLGFRYGSLAAALDKLAAGSKPDQLDPAALMPTVEQVRLAGIDFDVPDTGDKAKRLKGKLGAFDIKMGNHVGPVPTNVAIHLDRAQMDLPANTTDKGLKDILALGYKAVDVSMRYDQIWDQASKVLKLNELSLSSTGMFTASAKAEIGNVPKEIFTFDKATASVAALGVIAKSLSITVKNDSLFEKLIAQQAATQKRKPEEIRAELAMGATMMVPMFLGEHPGAQVLGAALGKFLADPKNLEVGLTAKGAGLGAIDFLAVKNPIEILKKLDITAEANK